MSQTVGALGEQALIDRIRRVLPASDPAVLVGPGDDAAVLESARHTALVVTTDALVEGVHFERAFVPFDAVGHKALAVNLSDLAAMGATPGPCVLSLGLPDDTEVAAIDHLLDGLLKLAAGYRVTVVGGNLARSPHVMFVDVTALGWVRRRRILRRHGARPGDEVWVSGELGAAAAGLEWLRERGAGRASSAPTIARGSGVGGQGSELPDDPDLAACCERFLRPEPRIRLGRALGGHRVASACIDLSDGLGDGARQLAAAARVGMAIDAEALPVAPGAARWFAGRGDRPVERAIRGGEDYELLFTAAPRFRRRVQAVARQARVRLTHIGSVLAEPRMVLRQDGGEDELPPGFAHFR